MRFEPKEEEMTQNNGNDRSSWPDFEDVMDRRRMLKLAGTAGLTLAGGSLLAPSALAAGPGKPVKTEPTHAFKQSSGGAKPSLPERAAYALDIDQGEPAQWNSWMAKSCPKFGLGFTSTNSNQNSATQVHQVDQILQRGVAGLMIDPVDQSVGTTMLNAMKSGVAVFALNFYPSTCQIGANQYNQAKMSTEAAVRYIHQHFGGKADVVYINWNANVAIRPRDQGVHDVIKKAGPNIRLIADIPAGTNETQVGFNIMNTILHRYPTARVVIGDDTVMQGAAAAMVAAGLGDSKDYLLVGCDGAPETLALIKSQKSVFRITSGFLLNAIGYFPAKYTRDWLEGKSIPQVLLFNPILCDSPETVARLDADNDNVINVLKDPAKSAHYLKALGSISYASRLGYYEGYAH
jgi:ABC-type sugar transport system substrate-binding protein